MPSIIPQDPVCPIDESVLIWGDEVHDGKVENLLKLISRNHVFSKEMFRGGATKVDVQRMREKPKAPGKKKRALSKDKLSAAFDESKFFSIVSEILKQGIERIDENLAAVQADLQEVSSSALSYQASVVSTVESMLKVFREEIVSSVLNGNCKPGVAPEPTTPRVTQQARV